MTATPGENSSQLGPDPHSNDPQNNDPRAVPQVVGPDGTAVEQPTGSQSTPLNELVEQPAKVMRIGGMIRQLLEEVKSASLDDAGRARLADIYDKSIDELKDGLAPELVEELERLSSPFDSESPSESELRIVQAQIVGWLEGLFHGIQAALYAQQVQAQSQIQNMRLALPGGQAPEGTNSDNSAESGDSGGLYL